MGLSKLVQSRYVMVNYCHATLVIISQLFSYYLVWTLLLIYIIIVYVAHQGGQNYQGEVGELDQGVEEH
jgi:hypothetical protein